MKKFQMVGHITTDLKKETGGTKQITFVRFGVAVGYKEKAEFFYLTAFRKNADFLCNHFKKGMWIQVCGELNSDQYTDAEGRKIYQTKLIATEIEFAGYNKKESSTYDDEYVPPEFIDQQ